MTGRMSETDKLTSYECAYRKKTPFGADHKLDVHWKISNAQLFAKTFTFDELSADAIEIPSLASCALGLGYTARALTGMHAPLRACPRAVLRRWKPGICR